MPLTFDEFWQEWTKPLTRCPERLCHMSDINEVFAKIGELMDFPRTLTARVRDGTGRHIPSSDPGRFSAHG